ncbi:MAG: DNA repair protein RecN [Candidatus Wallbacteria bacterium HGW-Wallbacteria-1]|uniref:DNA repair protein RecN n=1 Tax=Candidatus Wallbacteria bacterium HGW-Wallbacteria-1 TaxID=2013854 RepID=A0A2N1PS15_9BACT|nr:MAG: DNA repair protein RecN [Candidatus Wallbacteria bacterium HGW-Wallbacteria-1]
MILQFHIRGFVLIDDVEMDLGPGLNVITGETGAGKSLIMKALNLLMGIRLGDNIVRSGRSEAIVEGLFDLAQWPEIAMHIAELTGIESISIDQQAVISRVITDQNRSICRINGSLISLTTLRDISERLIDIHNQHHNQWILFKDRHLELLDNFGSDNHRKLLADYSNLFIEAKKIGDAIKSVESQLKDKELTLDLLNYQVREIAMAGLESIDESELLGKRKILANQESILNLCAEAEAALENEGVIEKIQILRARTARFSDLSAELSEASELFETASVNLTEARMSLERFSDSLSHDSEEAASIDATLSSLETLKRKYGSSINDILIHKQTTEMKITELENMDADFENMKKKMAKLESELLTSSLELTESRKELAARLSSALMDELKSLGIPSPRVDMRINPRGGKSTATEHLKIRGGDDLEFLVAFNAGEPLLPIQNVASGGEISRVMLCMKKVFASFEPRPTMIFDEIDTGIGGKTANMVGEKIREISDSRQVIVITHLPQIASLASRHFLVEKREKNGRTTTHVLKVQEDARGRILAAMMGSEVETAVAHAREMMEKKK